MKELEESVAKVALPLLVERSGGSVEITESEILAFMERHPRAGLLFTRTDAGIRLTVVETDQ